MEALLKSTSFELALYKISVTVSPSSMDSAKSTVLQSGWVQLFTIPDHAKNVNVVMAIVELVGEVLVVDEVSLIMVGPIWVKIRARDIAKINGFM